MPCDLEVDTDLITHAISQLRTAIDELNAANVAPPEIASTAAGHCAAGREALAVSRSRMAQSHRVLGALGVFAEHIETGLGKAVSMFVATEKLCLTGQ